MTRLLPVPIPGPAPATPAAGDIVPAPKRPLRLPVQARDLQGLARLAVDATLGITNVVESMHHTIASGAGIVGPARTGPARGISGGVYRSVRGVTRAVGWGVDGLLGRLAQWRPGPADLPPSPEREAALAVLNGVWGDHLVDTGNPLAIPMRWRVRGRPLPAHGGWADQLPQANGRVLVMVHGLCMNDLQFLRNGHDHGAWLRQTAGYTPVYLHYNTGRHVSQNGRDLAAALSDLQAHWPVPVRELVILGHSMGGLVARSACHLAAAEGRSWLRQLKALVFLGTPHHGAPLERGGHLIDRLLGVSPYVAPFALLGQARSAGITDLRYGNLQDADWQGRPRHHQRHDNRQPTPLPAGVPAYLVAATTAARADALRSRTLGDGLVPLASALGQHARAEMALPVPPERQRVVTSANHWSLLEHPEVAAALRQWLA